MNLDLRTYSTFNIGGIAHNVFEIKEKTDVEKIDSYCEYVNKPLVIIGEGTNSIFGETTDKYVIGLMKIPGIEILLQTDDAVLIRAFAGEYWDTVVSWCVEHGLSGIEPLSGIPGTAGAAPIQNIGAYGSELSKNFIEAEVFDRKTKSFITITHGQCDFGYRESIFKKNKDRYIIISITLKLSTNIPTIPQYKDVQEYFKNNSNPTTKEIRDAIIEIRKNKIPDYKKYPNCGSFFKNPIITKEHLELIKKEFPNIPSFEVNNTMHKVFAGWLIEHVDYKSAQIGSIIFNETNKLVLINTKDSSFADLQDTISNIIKLIQDRFTITLEIEPNIFN